MNNGQPNSPPPPDIQDRKTELEAKATILRCHLLTHLAITVLASSGGIFAELYELFSNHTLIVSSAIVTYSLLSLGIYIIVIALEIRGILGSRATLGPKPLTRRIRHWAILVLVMLTLVLAVGGVAFLLGQVRTAWEHAIFNTVLAIPVVFFALIQRRQIRETLAAQESAALELASTSASPLT